MVGKEKKEARKGWEMPEGRRSASESPPSTQLKKLKQWSNESMVKAMEAVRSEEMKINKAASVLEVPPTTLEDRLSGRVKHGVNPGPIPYLSMVEEAEFTSFLIQSSGIGYGKTKREVINIVKQTLEKEGRKVNEFNGEGWTRFMERNPKLSLRTADPLSRVRKGAVTEENIKQYFLLLEKTLREKDLLNKASRIYDMDETGMPLDAKPLKRVALRGARKVQGPLIGDKSQITVVACANAAGRVLPPMVIF